jgi:hypothetical protein
MSSREIQIKNTALLMMEYSNHPITLIDEQVYEQKIFSTTEGKFIAKKPQFLVFFNGGKRATLESLIFLKDVSKELGDKVDIGVVNSFLSENITLAHDIYYDVTPVAAVYMDAEGITYRYNRPWYRPNVNETEVISEWISKK